MSPVAAPGAPPTTPILVPSFVGGRDVPPADGRWVHTVRASALLEDTFTALRLKKNLDAGVLTRADAGPSLVGACALADDAVTEEALAAAAAAAPEWGRFPLRTRIDVGLRIGELIRRRRDELVEILVAEGQPRTLAAAMLDDYWSADFSPETLEWCAGQMHHEVDDGRRRRVVRRVPDGVVVVNPPQNAATANALFAMAALVAGNTVVVRAPRSLPLATSVALREVVLPALEEVGAPPGTLNVVCSSPTMSTWLASPHVDSLVYVGGSEKGLAVERDAVAAGVKPVLELAGNDGVVIWRDADLDGAVAALTENFRQSGQICNIPNHAIVHPAVADEVVERLRAAAAAVRPGPPEDPDVVLTPLLMAGQHFADIADALAHGARLEHGGRRLEVDGSVSDTGMFVEPTVLRVDGLARARATRAVVEETFSPLMPVVVPDAAASDAAMLDQILAFVDGNAYGLRNSLWTGDEAVAERFVERVTNCGVININDSHAGFLPLLPTHGGTGMTGGTFGEANYLMLRTSRLQGVDLVRAFPGGSR